MFLIAGLVVVIGSIVGGCVVHRGQVAVPMQVNEFITTGGAGLGATLIGSPPPVVKRTFVGTPGLLRPNPSPRPRSPSCCGSRATCSRPRAGRG